MTTDTESIALCILASSHTALPNALSLSVFLIFHIHIGLLIDFSLISPKSLRVVA